MISMNDLISLINSELILVAKLITPQLILLTLILVFNLALCNV